MSHHPTAPKPITQNRYYQAAAGCLDNLLTYGTDRYGPVHTSMLMSVIDVKTNLAPQHVLPLDSDARCDSRPGRRNPAGCDLWDDQPLLQALYLCSTLSADNRYAVAADDYIQAFLSRAVKPNGLLAWGSHLYYDAYTDQIADDGQPWHEILLHIAQWPAMWRINPQAITREIQGIWEFHILNKATGQHNRHDDTSSPAYAIGSSPNYDFLGCGDFAEAAGPYAHAFAFLYSQTADPLWLQRAKLVADWHWTHRNPQTNLTAETPSSGSCTAQYCFTTVTGYHALALLSCYEVSRDPYFLNLALAYIKAWLTHAWDEQAGLFHAALALDATPVPERQKPNQNFAQYFAAAQAAAQAQTPQDRQVPDYPWLPTGYADTWPSGMFHFDVPLAAAQACIQAYELTQDPQLLDGARKWARHIQNSPPPNIGRRWQNEIFQAMPQAKTKVGAYADGYGRAICFYTRLYRATRDPAPLARATALADEAIQKLTENRWLKGHPAKPYYETTDGVGILLTALLELARET